MNIASHCIPPVPVDALSSAPGDRAVTWKWGLFIFYTDASISRKAKSSSFCSDVVIEGFDAASVTSVSRRCRPLVCYPSDGAAAATLKSRSKQKVELEQRTLK